jgi:DNA repair photolyase
LRGGEQILELEQVGENWLFIANLAIFERMARTINTTRTAQRILALRRTARRGGDVQHELDPIIEDLRGDLDDTMSKAQAAKVIGVSVPTLDKWIEQRIVPVKRAASGRPRIPRDTALDLAERVAELRHRGRERNLIIALVDQLQRDDPVYQREFRKLYGPGLRALAKGDLVSAAPTDAFGPDD